MTTTQAVKLIESSRGVTMFSGMTAWSHKTRQENTVNGAPIVGPDGRYETFSSGISPVDDAEVIGQLRRHGHVILVNDNARGARSINHHMIGAGVGHDDAKFAETGESMAAYYESGEAFRGETWWSDPSEARFSPIRAYYDRRHPDFCAKTGHSAP